MIMNMAVYIGVQDEVSMNENLGVETVEQYDKNRLGNINFSDSNGLCNKPCVLRKDDVFVDGHSPMEIVEQYEESRKGNENFNNSNHLYNKNLSSHKMFRGFVCS